MESDRTSVGKDESENGDTTRLKEQRDDNNVRGQNMSIGRGNGGTGSPGAAQEIVRREAPRRTPQGTHRPREE